MMKGERKPIVAIIGTAGLPPRYGGFETLANFLTERLRDRFDFLVYCPGAPLKQRVASYNGARLVYLPFKANGPQSIVYDVVSIIRSVASCDRLLILGSGGAVILPFLFAFKSKFVLNFGGLEWERAKWGALTRFYLKLTEALGVRFSGKIIADNQCFVDYIRAEYGKCSHLIEYGGDHCAAPTGTNSDLRKKYDFLGSDYFLSVSRAQPDNNIHLLLESFAALVDYRLVVVSNWGVSEYGRSLKERYSGSPNMVLLDAIYDMDVLNSIRSLCHVYIHSHSFCGTAPSLVEIMNLGKPVLSFDAPTNRQTTEGRALYFSTAEELGGLVAGTPASVLGEMGAAMREIAARRYTWDVIASKYADCLA